MDERPSSSSLKLKKNTFSYHHIRYCRISTTTTQHAART